MYNSSIQWTDATVNFWTGCKKVSPGCKFCYMYRDKERYGLDPTVITRTSDKTFYAAKKWADPKLIFTCSWSDFFIEEADEWRADAWEVIKSTPQHTWQILTKRPERVAQCLPSDWGEGYDNVWIGVTIETEAVFLNRAILLREIPAKGKFISFEPLLEMIMIDSIKLSIIANVVDWAIIGGESGNDTGKYQYRKAELRWFRLLIKQLGEFMPLFVKQLGTGLAKELELKDRHGGDISEFPEELRIREMPRFWRGGK